MALPSTLAKIPEGKSLKRTRGTDNPEMLHRPCQHVSSLPTWNLSPLASQQSKQNSCCGSYSHVDIDKIVSKKHIVTQLAPEEFSLEDVQHLQKLVRELHSENMQKTLSYFKLEQAYHSLKDENAKLKCGTDSTPVQSSITTNLVTDTMEKRKLEEELHHVMKKCYVLQSDEQKLRQAITDCEERLAYFNQVFNQSNVVLAENKQSLNATIHKVQFLETELDVWKKRSNEYQRLLMEKINILSPEREFPDMCFPHPRSSTLKCRPNKPMRSSFTSVDDSVISFSSKAGNIEKDSSSNSIYKYLAPKASSCFSCVKAALCHCPMIPVQDSVSVRKTGRADGKK